VKPGSKSQKLLQQLAVAYSRQLALQTLKQIRREQEQLLKDTRRLNVRSVLGKSGAKR